MLIQNEKILELRETNQKCSNITELTQHITSPENSAWEHANRSSPATWIVFNDFRFHLFTLDELYSVETTFLETDNTDSSNICEFITFSSLLLAVTCCYLDWGYDFLKSSCAACFQNKSCTQDISLAYAFYSPAVFGIELCEPATLIHMWKQHDLDRLSNHINCVSSKIRRCRFGKIA